MFRFRAFILLWLCLKIVTHAAPTVTITPTPGTSVASLTSITATFSEAVAGVDASDLIINANPAISVSVVGNAYTFTFTQPPPGTVNVSFDVDHGIAGASGSGAFVASPPVWTYTLTDGIAPTIAKIGTSQVSDGTQFAVIPLPGSKVNTFTQTSVTFSETVTGVDAADLLVNGNPATGVTGSGAGPYVFTFTQPAAGTVSFTWAAGHGIIDTASNALVAASNTWSVTRDTTVTTAVVINEFLAANGNGLVDENSNSTGWIELKNTSAAAIDLTGWSLSDDPAIPGKWVLPTRSLAANGFLVIFASAKDRKPASAASNLHTNFTLGTNGGYLALYPPSYPLTAVSQYPSNYPASTDYPEQRFDVSYGLNGATATYFGTPTPNAANNAASALSGLVPDPNASVSRGFFTDPFSLILTCTDAAATIRYTLNGTVPTAASTAYSGPLNISTTTVLRIAAFKAGSVSSHTITHSYIFLDAVLNQPSPPYNGTTSVLPTISSVPVASGGTQFPLTWGDTAHGSGDTRFTAANTFVGSTNNLNAGDVPADYGMDPEILNDPTKYDDTGAINAATGITNLARVKRGLRELPLMSIVMNNVDLFDPTPNSLNGGIYANPTFAPATNFEKPCSMELLMPDGSAPVAITCSIRIHGNGSRIAGQQPKHGFKLNFSGSFGASSLKYALFPDSPSGTFDDLILRADYNYSWLHSATDQRPRGTRIRDAFCKDTFRDMGQAAGHSRFVHLFINGIYWGIYDPTEQENATFGATYFGGDKHDYDSYNQNNLQNAPTGNSTAYNAMTAIGTTSSLTNTDYENLKGYLDVTEFADYILLHLYLGHTDWGTDPTKNWYAVNRHLPGGRFRYLPWDMENVMTSSGQDDTNATSFPGPSSLHGKLVNNAQYKLDFADRVNKHMVQPNGALTPTPMVNRWNKWVAVILDAMACESARWGDYRRDVHQYNGGTFPLSTWNGFTNGVATAGGFTAEVANLRNNYFPGRTATVLTQLRSRGLYPTLNAPEFRNFSDSVVVGSKTVTAGYQFKLMPPTTPPGGTTNSNTIYYTLDNSDPRVYYGTGLALTPSAILQTSPTAITVNSTVTCKARAWDGTNWSALSVATFTVGATEPTVHITELHYNPPNNQGGSSAEFIELQNTGATDVDLSGWYFDGVDFIFPRPTVIGPGARLVLANNNGPSTFAAQYPSVTVFGYYGGSLDNSGERVSIYDSTGKLIESVDYDVVTPWPTTPKGGGYSLERINLTGDPDSPYNWKASAVLKGTPGAPNGTPAAPTVYISEFFANNGGAYSFGGVNPGYVELYNSSGSAADVSSWTINSAASIVTLAPGTSIPGGGYLLIHYSTTALAAPSSLASLPTDHGEIYVATSSGTVVDGVHFGPQAKNFSFSRLGSTWAASNGAWTLSNPTPGAANAAATAGTAATSLRLNEWLANRAPGGDDWLELDNLDNAKPILLTGLYYGAGPQVFRMTAPAAIAPASFLQLFCNAGSSKGDNLDFQLVATGSTLTLADTSETVFDTVTYGAQAQEVSQGRLPNGTGAVVTLPYQSPAAANYAAVTGAPVLNEILTNNLHGDNAPWALRSPWLELKNPTGSGLSLAGWQLRNPKNPAVAWTIPAGVSISAGGYLAIWAEATQPASTINATHLNYNLAGVSGSPLGNGVELVNAQGQIVDRIQWGKQIPDLSIGRLPDNSWALLAAPTRGAVNAAAATLGPQSAVRINEWYAASVAPDDDYVELYNTSNLPVSLGGLYLSDDPSEVGREKYRIPALSYIAGNGFALFTAAGSVPDANTTAFGLSNTGEYLRLGLSDDTQVDALGFGLQTVAQSQGRQPEGSTSTASFARTPGLANVQGTGPWFTSLPPNQVITAGTGTTLSITAINATSYQWRRNGQPIGGASGTTYSISSATINDDGVYDCIATGPGGSTTSAASSVTILYTYALWAAEKGLAGPNSGPTEDKDNDGLSNLAEFFANSDPLVSDNAAQRLANQVQGGLELSGGQPAYLTLDFRLNRRASLNGYTGEMNTLLPGVWGAIPPSSADLLNVEANGDQHWHFRYAVPPGAPQRFLRMTIVP